MRGRIDSRGHLVKLPRPALQRRVLFGGTYAGYIMRRSMSEFGGRAEVARQSDEGRC